MSIIKSQYEMLSDNPIMILHNPDHLNWLREEVTNIKQRVRWLYEKLPTTIHSDNYLIDYYKVFFGSDSIDKRSDQIKRAGRFWRQKHKQCSDNHCLLNTPKLCFRRTEAEVIKATEQEAELVRLFT